METRKTDALGRIVIPKDLRIKYDIMSEGSDIDIIPTEEGILLKKHCDTCAICGSSNDLVNYAGKYYCRTCIKNLNTEAKMKWGDTEAYKDYQKKAENMSEADKQLLSGELMNIFGEFGEIKSSDPTSDSAQELVLTLQKYITDNYYKCTDDILRGLGQMYVNDMRFKKSIDDTCGEGTAELVSKAIAAKK